MELSLAHPHGSFFRINSKKKTMFRTLWLIISNLVAIFFQRSWWNSRALSTHRKEQEGPQDRNWCVMQKMIGFWIGSEEEWKHEELRIILFGKGLLRSFRNELVEAGGVHVQALLHPKKNKFFLFFSWSLFGGQIKNFDNWAIVQSILLL